ncbi:MAG: hypothetical protein K6G81_03790 [Lachnospiraceae bacterium]|nr:hypothetical protein [Lachnospiraceae bacterium]
MIYSNLTIVSVIIRGWRESVDRYGSLPTRTYLRLTLQYINALGGGVLLDMFESEEIE